MDEEKNEYQREFLSLNSRIIEFINNNFAKIDSSKNFDFAEANKKFLNFFDKEISSLNGVSKSRKLYITILFYILVSRFFSADEDRFKDLKLDALIKAEEEDEKKK